MWLRRKHQGVTVTSSLNDLSSRASWEKGWLCGGEALLRPPQPFLQQASGQVIKGRSDICFMDVAYGGGCNVKYSVNKM
jgi:hypothetical protein